MDFMFVLKPTVYTGQVQGIPPRICSPVSRDIIYQGTFLKKGENQTNSQHSSTFVVLEDIEMSSARVKMYV